MRTKEMKEKTKAQKLKTGILAGMSSIAVVLATVTFGTGAISRASLNDFSQDNKANKEINTYSAEAVPFAYSAGQSIVENGNITYIYDAAGLATFRNNVNNGNNYSRKNSMSNGRYRFKHSMFK